MGEVSHEVLAERIAQVRADIKRSDALTTKELEQMEARFQGYVHNAVFEAFKQNIDQRIKPLEKVIYGVIGLVGFTVLGAILGTVLILN